jgi:SNF2 family DNA or RNA helicase
LIFFVQYRVKNNQQQSAIIQQSTNLLQSAIIQQSTNLHNMPKFVLNTGLSQAIKVFKENGVELYPHQKEGINWLIEKERKGNGGLLADDMGLGKTIQMIGLMIGNPQKITIIVSPSSLENQWKSEIKKFCPSSIKVLDIFDYETKKGDNNVIITSYHKLMYNFTSHLETYMENTGGRFEIDRIICDEAHFFRNSKSVSFKSLDRIDTKYRWALSGTPIQNYLSDIKTLFKFLRLDDMELDDNIRDNMLRRTQGEVNLGLTKVKIKLLFVDIENDDDNYYRRVDDNLDMHHLEKSLRLRQVCVVPSSVSGILKDKYKISDDEKLSCVKLLKIISTLKKKQGEGKTNCICLFQIGDYISLSEFTQILQYWCNLWWCSADCKKGNHRRQNN